MKTKYQIGAVQTKIINEVNTTNMLTKNVDTSVYNKSDDEKK